LPVVDFELERPILVISQTEQICSEVGHRFIVVKLLFFDWSWLFLRHKKN
jgi:hypothetical protein